MGIRDRLEKLRVSTKNPFLKVFLEQYFDIEHKQKVNKLFKQNKDIEAKIKTTEEIAKIHRAIDNKKEQVYNELREQKIKRNEIIPLKSYEVKIVKKKGGLLDNINIFKKKEIIDYVSLYLGYGGIAKFIQIPKQANSSFIVEDRELYNYQRDIENKNEKSYFMDGKKLLFIHNKVIFNAEFDDQNKKFIYDLTPDYYYMVIDNVIDNKLTQPVVPKEDIGNFIQKYWKLIVVGIIAYFIMQVTQKKPETPIIFPFFLLSERFKKWLFH